MSKIKYFCFFIVFILMSFKILAVTVSDNDGSAFISKAEFDSLKNAFQAEIDQYNTTIDSKIDASIASYLAGIQLASQLRLTNYINTAKKRNENNVKFMKWSTPASSRSYGGGYYDVEAAYVVAQIYGVNVDNNSSQRGLYNYTITSNAAAWGAQVTYADYKGTATSNYEWTGQVKDYKSAYYWIKFPFKGEGQTYENVKDWSLKDVVRHRLHMKLEASKISFQSAQTGNYTATTIGNLNKISGKTLTTDFTSLSQPGITEGSSQGTQIVTDLKPTLAMVHNWSQFDEDSDFSSEDDEKKNECLKYNISGEISDATIAGVEYERRDYYDSSAVTRTIMTKPVRSGSSDGSRPGLGIGLIWQTYTIYSRRNWNEYYNDLTFEFKWKNPKYYNLNYRNLTTDYYNTLFGEAYYKYYGIPITKVDNDGKLVFYLTFNNSTADDYKYCIMDKKFDNGDTPDSKKETLDGVSYERVLKKDTIKGTKGEKEVKIEVDKKAIFDKEKGDYIYLKIEPSESGQLVSVDCTKDVILESKK